MGAGHLKLRKVIKNETLWQDKSRLKHKCDFTEKCILKVINNVNDVALFNVIKCNKCLSFKSIREEGNVQGRIFKKLSKEQEKLPIITAECSSSQYIIPFQSLKNVNLNK